MPIGTIEDTSLKAEIERLPFLSLNELRSRWKTLFGHPAPKSLRRIFIARAVAYQMQAAAYGGLSNATLRKFAKSPMPYEMAVPMPCLAAPVLGRARR